MSGATPADVEPVERMRVQHQRQRRLGAIVGPLWIPIVVFGLRWGLGYRVADVARIRAEYARIRAESSAPLLICANHLTLIDSMIVALALAPCWRYVLDFDALPWNTPEETNFANTLLNRVLVYFAKCIPIRRGGNRQDVAEVLERISYLLGRGETALLFPEGGRSRSGRVEPGGAAWGVGRIVASVPGCRVLCVYMRGDAQATWSDYPARGDVARVSLSLIEPKSDARGVRRTRDLAEQIVSRLSGMEEQYFHARQ